MVVEIFTVLKNAEYILPLYLKHYITNFPGCIINIYDNNSTDNSRSMCTAVGCNVYNFPAYTEQKLKDFKNNIWKTSKADWIIICDVDELLQITQEEMPHLSDVNAIKFVGYNMTGGNVPEELTHGFPSPPYNKVCMFRNIFEEINYKIGAHICTPTPTPTYSDRKFFLFHYNKV